MPKLNIINSGDYVRLDGGFTCRPEGLARVHSDNDGLFFYCDDQKHYLDGQENEDGYLTGISEVVTLPDNDIRGH